METNNKVATKRQQSSRRCIINGCKSASLKDPSLKFFRFPSPNTPDYRIWMTACSQSYEHIISLKKPLLCSLHFLPEQVGGRRLTPNAYPRLRLSPSEEFIEIQKREAKLNLLDEIVMEWLVRNRSHCDIYGKLLIEKAREVRDILEIPHYKPNKGWLKKFNELMAAPNSRLFRTNDVTCGPSLHIKDVVHDVLQLQQSHLIAQSSFSESNSDSIEISDDDNDCDVDYSDVSIDISNKLEVFMTVDEDRVYHDTYFNKFQPTDLNPKDEIQQYDTNGQQTIIGSYKQALKYLKPLEDFALQQEDFRSIGLLTQLEAVFSESQ